MASFVLVPGAGGDPAFWSRLMPELSARGHEAIAVRLPAGDDSAGWREYADAIVAAARDRRGVVIVAQSLGGFSAPLACDRLDATLLVLLNAMIPLPGETGMEWWSNTGSGAAQLAYFDEIGLPASSAADDAVVYFHDLPPAVLDEMLAGPPPEQSMTPMHQPWPMDAWPNVKTVVLAAQGDRLFPAEFQRRVARERLGLEPEPVPGGHLAALSHPAELAERLADVVARSSGPGSGAQAGTETGARTADHIGGREA